MISCTKLSILVFVALEPVPHSFFHFLRPSINSDFKNFIGNANAACNHSFFHSFSLLKVVKINMAFAQQHRRPTQRLSVTQREYDNNNDSAALHDDTLLSPRRPSSDSDNDWHVISSAIPPTSSSSSLQRRESASPASDPSEPESFSSFRHSDDIEWLSDFDTQSSSARDDEFIANLPTHDGTGLFGEQYSDTSPLSPDESDSPTSFARAVQRISDDRQRSAERTWRAQAIDFEPDSPSKPNILLPYGGINAPSFANKSRHTRSDDNSNNNDSDDSSQVSLPSFVPTVPGFTTSDMSADKDSRRDSDAQTSEVSSTPDTKSNVKFTRRRRRNLDRFAYSSIKAVCCSN